ncbi:MAG: hypothetical protein ACRCYQ_02890 [Nocardioides sp.]
MDVEVAAAAVGAMAALLGAGVAGGISIWIESRRSAAVDRAVRRNDLLESCAAFTGSITMVKSLSYRVAEEPSVDAAIVEAMDRARIECERLRLLLESRDTQEAARLALRHAHAVWRHARDGVDPHADRYPGEDPLRRLRAALTRLYVGVRTETGSAAPTEVFDELDG